MLTFLQQTVNSANGSKPEKSLANSKQNPQQPQLARNTLSIYGVTCADSFRKRADGRFGYGR
jgi:hypothetical protein